MPREATATTTLTIQGIEISKLGFGTWQLTGRACAEGVRDALELGYRHVDTARAYGNERQYVDLLLIHWPNAGVPLAETLGAMSEQREQGKVRHLGVSNFPSRLVREAREIAPIVCDEVEYHPYSDSPRWSSSRASATSCSSPTRRWRTPRRRATRCCARSARRTARAGRGRIAGLQRGLRTADPAWAPEWD